ncbi:hypothetical protein ACTMTU_10765 [Streptomyces sp. OZ13]|uniref:hypothetical protein n=1 Tax=Streptomyces sp. OZ13 TaxID=3452210 RepID=UPI003F8A6C2D
MANLVPDNGAGEDIGQAGGVRFIVDPSGAPVQYRLWERIVNGFSSAPAYSKGGLFTSTTPVTKAVPKGSLYQARLRRESDGPNGPVLGKLDMPVLDRVGRKNYLTACAEKPMVDIKPGGTFVSFAFATSTGTMARVQLGANAPELVGGAQFPRFHAADVLASAVSLESDVIHRVSVMDELTDPGTTDHAPLLSGEEVFYTILVWDGAGNWDVLWSKTGSAPAATPEKIKLLDRVVRARIDRLYCFEDSDSETFGEADFWLRVKDDTGAEQKKKLRWNPMASNSFAPPIAPATTEIKINPPNARKEVTVRVTAWEDDEGSVNDVSDTAATVPSVQPLHFPLGEGNERIPEKVFTLDSTSTGGDDILKFQATIAYSVDYT